MANPGIGNKLSFGINFSCKLKFANLLLMRYLAYMGRRVAAEGRSIEQQVLEVNMTMNLDLCDKKFIVDSLNLSSK